MGFVSGTIRSLFLIPFLISLGSYDAAYLDTICQNTANYTSNSTYSSNLKLLLSFLYSNASFHNGFFNSTAGQDPDSAYGSFLCRFDITREVCQDCVELASQDIVQRCPNQRGAVTWYDGCRLRYSNRSFFSIMDGKPKVGFVNQNNVSIRDRYRFDQLLVDGVNSLANRVAFDPSLRMFATGEVKFPDHESIYSLVQCTPDLSGSDCTTCLRDSVAQLSACCKGSVGAQIHGASCSVIYDLFRFYSTVPSPESPPPLLLPHNPTRTGGKKSISTEIIIIVVVISTVVTLILLSIICFIFWRRNLKEKVNDALCEDEDVIRSFESLQFDFGTISIATDDFSDANKLGEGGFGAVFKGMLSNGQEIAVKRLCSNSGQGNLEFKNEVVLVAKLQHRNLVKLLGFCLEGEEKLLIYEFVPNASLDYFIFDPVKRTQLDWERRYRIIGGITRGLLYLHEDSRLKIIHRDLKASNILLDEDMNPKISDFGMARLFVVDQTRENTNRVVGTFGYMAPEYAIQGQFSVKSDVFSFGVLLLEIVSGKKSTSFFKNTGNLLSYAWVKWRQGAALELTDSTLRECLSISEGMRCIHIGLLCVQENIASRPTMASVVLMLNSYDVPLPLPSQPAFYLHSGTEPNTPMGEYNSHEGELEDYANQSAVLSMNEGSISELSPR